MLLAVFLPMLVLSSAHVHSYSHSSMLECSQCVHHMPHNGHIAKAQVGIHDCILCQLVQLTFLLGTTVLPFLPLHLRHVRLLDPEKQIRLRPMQRDKSRAPPFI